MQVLYFTVDIDECVEGLHSCHVNANCTNTLGSYLCACLNGHIGNGNMCTGKRLTLFSGQVCRCDTRKFQSKIFW